MAKNRKGNFVVSFSYIEGVKADAKRASVQNRAVSKGDSASAWKLVCDLQKHAMASPFAMLVNVIVCEDDKEVWRLR